MFLNICFFIKPTFFAKFSGEAEKTFALSGPLVAASAVLTPADSCTVLAVAVLWAALATRGADVAQWTRAAAGVDVTDALVVALTHPLAVRPIPTLFAT